jgi:hypothetical protein
MNYFDRSTFPATTRIHSVALALCWAALAYCRIAGIDMHVMTAGPAFAPRPAQVAMQRLNLLG